MSPANNMKKPTKSQRDMLLGMTISGAPELPLGSTIKNHNGTYQIVHIDGMDENGDTQVVVSQTIYDNEADVLKMDAYLSQPDVKAFHDVVRQ